MVKLSMCTRLAGRAMFALAAFLMGVILTIGLCAGRGWAQSVPATVRDYVGPSAPLSESAAAPDSGIEEGPLAPAPVYCSPCLYYSGDLDPSGPNPDGLSDENDTIVSLSQILTPFSVPAGHTWLASGLLANVLTTQPKTGGTTRVHVPNKVGWSIWRGTSAGVPGTLLFAGANGAPFSETGRSLAGLTEYTVHVVLPAPITLGPGTYFLSLMPQCTNSSSCSSQRFFESDVEDPTPAHHHGPANLVDQSFFSSNFFVADYVATTTEGVGLDLFSFGVIGTCTVNGTGAYCPF